MFTLTSSAFEDGAAIPVRHTCDGDDLSPPLAWEGAPPGTRSFVLIVSDPDCPDPAAPTRTWVHWVRYNIPGDVHVLAEGAGHEPPDAGADVLTDADELGYHGPCPPIGRHRYFFRLYALDALLPALRPDARERDVETAMAQHVLGEAVLMGTCERGARRNRRRP